MKKIYRIPRVSKKQWLKNSELARIKKTLVPVCCICGQRGSDLMHLLPRSTYPEHYLNPLNLAIGCRCCHNKYDVDIEFRQKQTKLYEQICSFDRKSADKYFQY